MFFKLFFLKVAFLSGILSAKTNFKELTIKNCSEYYADNPNYKYFDLSFMRNEAYKEEIFRYKFYVSAITNEGAHFLFTQDNYNLEFGQNAYEITIDEDMHESTIRDKYYGAEIRRPEVKEIFEESVPIQIEIVQTRDNRLQVYVASSLLMEQKFKSIDAVQYIWLRSFGFRPTLYFYNCHDSDYEKLKNNISIYQMDMPNVAEAKFSIQIVGLSYNWETSTVTTNAIFNFSWVDDRFKWRAFETGMETIAITSNNIWAPELHIINPATTTWDDIKLNAIYDGVVRYNSQVHLKSNEFCFEAINCEENFNTWISNNFECRFALKFNGNLSEIFEFEPIQDVFLLNVKKESEPVAAFVSFHNNLLVTLKFSRNNIAGITIFFIGLFAFTLTILLSFIKTEYPRIFISLIAFLLLAIAFLIIALDLSVRRVPILLLCYHGALFVFWVIVTLQIIFEIRNHEAVYFVDEEERKYERKHKDKLKTVDGFDMVDLSSSEKNGQKSTGEYNI